MTHRYWHYRGLMVGAFLVGAPIFDVLAGGAGAGIMHLVSALAGVALLALSLLAGIDRASDTDATMPVTFTTPASAGWFGRGHPWKSRFLQR